MSERRTVTTVVEWAPGDCRAYDRKSRRHQRGNNLSEATSGFDTGHVLVGVSRTASFVRSVNFPATAGANLDALVRNVVPTLVPISGPDLAYGYEISPKSNGKGPIVSIGAMSGELLTSLRTEARSAGIHVVAVVPVAFGGLAVADQQQRSLAAVLDESGENLSIDMIDGGVLRYSRVSSAGDDVNQELLRAFAASGISVAPTIYCGEGQFVADHISNTSTLEALATSATLPEIQTAKERHDQRVRAQNSARLVSGGILAASIVLASLLSLSRLSTARKIHDTVAASDSEMTNLRRVRDHEMAAVTAATPAFQLTKRAFEPAQKMSDVISLLTNDAPSGLWLNGISLERGRPMTFRGTALASNSVSDYVQRLSSEARLRDVKLQFANNGTVNNQAIVQFSITAFPVGNLPLTDSTISDLKKVGP